MKPIGVSLRRRACSAWLRSGPSGAASLLFLCLLGMRPLGAQALLSQGVGAQAPQPAAAPEPWMNFPPTSTGLAVGQKIPSFRAPDQNGRMQDFNSIRGPQGAAIYFVRSADW